MKPDKKGQRLIFTAFLFIVFSFTSPVYAAGILKPENGDNTIHMKSHRVDVTINNGFARTQVEQVFVNTGSGDLEAVYSFPIPDKASLSELSL